MARGIELVWPRLRRRTGLVVRTKVAACVFTVPAVECVEE